MFIALFVVALAGCTGGRSPEGEPDAVWGGPGGREGYFQKPRAFVIDDHDRVFVVDKSARIQVFDLDGHFSHGWRTPDFEFGKPTGLSLDHQGRLLVADTHYQRMLVYQPDGTPVPEATIRGRYGTGPGEFGFITDVVQDSQGNYYISEYGDFDRIQKFSPAGQFLLQWGGHGHEPGQFLRPQSLDIDEHDHVWVADACNHRIQVFDATGSEARLVTTWGRLGTAPGELSYPYAVVLDQRGHVYVCEYGNHRVQKFTRSGEPLGTWGSEGREPGQLFNPWSVALDRHGRVYVLDTNNHRVQRIRL